MALVERLKASMASGGVYRGHPKIKKMEDAILNHFRAFPGAETRVMVFSSVRDSVQDIAAILKEHAPTIRPISFIGQGKGRSKDGLKGLTQKEQAAVLDKFRKGVYNVLVATCVAEEGLDIGDVDLIVCFDQQGSQTRLVQRSGRTGRKRDGKIVYLVTEGAEEQSFRRSTESRKTIYKAIRNAQSTFEFYKDNPQMLPDKPAVLRKVMSAQKAPPSAISNRRRAKRKPAKIDWELTTSQTEQFSSDLKMSQPSSVDLQRFAHLQGVSSPSWLLDHSVRCNALIRTIKLIDQADHIDFEDHQVSMDVHLNQADVYPSCLTDEPPPASTAKRKKRRQRAQVQLDLDFDLSQDSDDDDLPQIDLEADAGQSKTVAAQHVLQTTVVTTAENDVSSVVKQYTLADNADMSPSQSPITPPPPEPMRLEQDIDEGDPVAAVDDSNADHDNAKAEPKTSSDAAPVSSQPVSGQKTIVLSHLQGSARETWSILKGLWPTSDLPTTVSYTPSVARTAVNKRQKDNIMHQDPFPDDAHAQPADLGTSTATSTSHNGQTSESVRADQTHSKSSSTAVVTASTKHSQSPSQVPKVATEHKQLDSALKQIDDATMSKPATPAIADRDNQLQQDRDNNDDDDDDSPLLLPKRSRPSLPQDVSVLSSNSPTPQSGRRLKRKPKAATVINDGSPVFASSKRVKAVSVAQRRKFGQNRAREQARDFFLSQAEADESCYMDEGEDDYDTQDSFIDNGENTPSGGVETARGTGLQSSGSAERPIGTQQMAAIYQQSLLSPDENPLFQTRRNMLAPQGARFAFGVTTPPSQSDHTRPAAAGDDDDYDDPYSPKARRPPAEPSRPRSDAGTKPTATTHSKPASALSSKPFVLIARKEMNQQGAPIIQHLRRGGFAIAVVKLPYVSCILSHRSAVIRMLKSDVAQWHTDATWKLRIATATASYQNVFLIIEDKAKSKKSAPSPSAARPVESQAYYKALARLTACRLLVLHSDSAAQTGEMVEQLVHSEGKYVMPAYYRQAFHSSTKQVVIAVAQALDAPWSVVLGLLYKQGQVVPLHQAIQEIDVDAWQAKTGMARALLKEWAERLKREFDSQLLD
eukprot:TRINITY_DN10626_c0_g1_i1.p1 TRINITY_DN10626_c0_g1~~TRINITY_DN10626_c0_g1_i1.p1  ORF type:complete len:1189 (+),score=330.64 TRINITY_DN10626_c0_g1_i1:286-3567(+)